jgi:hypothetical protein
LSTAARRYRERHVEGNLPAPPTGSALWRHVVVIPAYSESGEVLLTLQELACQADNFLAILVINRPDSDGDALANEALRDAIMALPRARDVAGLHPIGRNCAVLLCDTEQDRGPLPADEGVGLARKIGCDIAWQWIDRGAIATHWIHCSDADARLPGDYFERTRGIGPGTAAVTYPFAHRPGDDEPCNRATCHYELRLHHYVLGLEYAGSPYAYHSLGSCLAVEQQAYARVRGFPRRAAAEDFYLLNKLAKVGQIRRLGGECIELASRRSHRVPFGTGPAVERISRGDLSATGFYHPRSFQALRAVLAVAGDPAAASASDLPAALQSSGLDRELAAECARAMAALGWRSALDHCLRHGKGEEQFSRHFHQWFDAFRTLKFIHALRERYLPQQSLVDLATLAPSLWPATPSQDRLAEAVRSLWGWTRRDPANS